MRALFWWYIPTLSSLALLDWDGRGNMGLIHPHGCAMAHACPLCSFLCRNHDLHPPTSVLLLIHCTRRFAGNDQTPFSAIYCDCHGSMGLVSAFIYDRCGLSGVSHPEHMHRRFSASSRAERLYSPRERNMPTTMLGIYLVVAE